MKDLIISAFTKYDVPKIHNYIQSINNSGFSGDKIMIVYDVMQDTIDYLKTNGWQVFQSDLSGHIHMHRLISIYSVLASIDTEYRYIITTDVRDVVFQRNPSLYLEQNLKKDILVSSENVLYENEPWGTKNILEGYNELLWSRYRNELSCNVGVLAGKYNSMKDLLLLNYLVSQAGDTTHFTDQSSFNFIIHNSLIKNSVQIEGLDTNWALQIGTLNNKDIIGQMNHSLEDYIIIHQYDRDLSINSYVEQKYR